ncbi:hypothetical protein RsTz2092_11440 [Deferribacterales bacterium RsTz2092]|nr:hypothetical protein AGMMS49941_05600 [Deferribacterales bacterium]GHU85588.1 hypothetical protein AGMMS49941_05670 [Deferribacterales bacterium]
MITHICELVVRAIRLLLVLAFVCASYATFTMPAVAADDYGSLLMEYNALLGKSRSAYSILGDRLYRLYLSDTNGSNASDALLLAGKTYKLSYEKYGQSSDMNSAHKYLSMLADNATYNTPDALLELAELYNIKRDYASAQFTLSKIKKRYPESNVALAADGMLADLARMGQSGGDNDSPKNYVVPKGIAEDIGKDNTGKRFVEVDSFVPEDASGAVVINDIRYFSASDYTRIVVDVSRPAAFEKYWLKENPAQKLPPRLYIDIDNATVGKGVAKDISIKDGLVSNVRWAYNRPGTTRIVLDSQSIQNFTVFQMSNPARIIIDVSKGDKFPKAQAITATPPPPSSQQQDAITRQPASSANQTLASVFGLKINTIVIDAGHGGKDPGCSYYGLKEKDITLIIAKQLRAMLKSKTKLNVYMTRETDVFIPLEERTAIANKLKADIFVSIHINAAPKNRAASGVETYILNITNDKAALEVAAFENQATTKSISDLQGILKDIMQSSKLEESTLLAKATQKGMANTMKLSNKQNIGIKQAPFFVLVGANMPAILTEVGFLSNKNEAERMRTSEYQKLVAQGIFNGILAYAGRYNQ